MHRPLGIPWGSGIGVFHRIQNEKNISTLIFKMHTLGREPAPTGALLLGCEPPSTRRHRMPFGDTPAFFPVAWALPAFLLSACAWGSGLLLRHPRLAMWLGLSGAIALSLAGSLTGATVLAIVAVFAWANLQMAHDTGDREEGALAPPGIGRAFSVLLALSLLASLPAALARPGLPGALFALATAVLALSALRIKWRVSEGRLGFSDTPFTWAYLGCMAYQALFLSPPAAGALAFVLLLVPYVPMARSGHDWAAHRLYSVGLFLVLESQMARGPWSPAPPLPGLEATMTALGASVLHEITLVTAIFFVGLVVLCRFTEWQFERHAERAAIRVGARARPEAHPRAH